MEESRDKVNPNDISSIKTTKNSDLEMNRYNIQSFTQA